MAEAASRPEKDRRVYFVIAGCVLVFVAAVALLDGTTQAVLAVIAAYWLLWRLFLLPFRGRRRPRWMVLVPVGAGLITNHWAAPALALVHGPPLIAVFGPRRDYPSRSSSDEEPLWRLVAIVALIEALGLALGVGLARLVGFPTLL